MGVAPGGGKPSEKSSSAFPVQGGAPAVPPAGVLISLGPARVAAAARHRPLPAVPSHRGPPCPPGPGWPPRPSQTQSTPGPPLSAMQAVFTPETTVWFVYSFVIALPSPAVSRLGTGSVYSPQLSPGIEKGPMRVSCMGAWSFGCGGDATFGGCAQTWPKALSSSHLPGEAQGWRASAP